MVFLEDVVDCLEMVSDELSHFYEKSTGEFLCISDEYFGKAEDILMENDLKEYSEDDLKGYPDWQKDQIRSAIKIMEEEDNYIRMPGKFDIDEYSMMRAFSWDYPDQTISDMLSEAINGRGAFRWFRNTIERLGIEKEWYQWRDQSYLALAKEWCEENNLSYSTKPKVAAKAP
jgi:hypothetical protein